MEALAFEYLIQFFEPGVLLAEGPRSVQENFLSGNSAVN